VLLLAALCFFVPTLSELFRLTTTGPVSVVTTALKWLLQVKDGEGIWGWLFSLTWVPYFALVAGAAALLLWANGALWQLFETRLASSRYDRPAVPRLRVWGLIVRVPLALGLAAGATIAARVHPLVLVGSLIAAVAVIAAPWFGRIPRTLAARTQPPD
jgi:hypothetical protein